MEEGYWNGLPTKIRKVTGTVRERIPSDPPLAWWGHLVGQRVEAVEVVLDGVNYGGGTIYIFDELGEGYYKVTEGQGSPNIGHREVPLIEVEDRE